MDEAECSEYFRVITKVLARRMSDMAFSQQQSIALRVNADQLGDRATYRRYKR